MAMAFSSGSSARKPESGYYHQGQGQGHAHGGGGGGAATTGCQNCSRPLEKFPKSYVLKGEAIGQPGGFGSVIKGQLNNLNTKHFDQVVVKMLHSSIGQKRYGVLQDMFNLNHRNLVPFLGILDIDPNDCPQLVFGPVSEGSLLDYIKDPNNAISAETLKKIALDVVHGMDYLHKMDFIHGCLAARNVLLDKSRSFLNAKISDYGMSRVIYGSGVNYYSYVTGKSIPIRWLPKECIPDNKNRCEIIKPSDVWAFGVVLWEVCTKGEVPYGPYGSVSNLEVKQHVLNGSSPLAFRRPENCGPSVLIILENIFKVDPESRPTFEILAQMLHAVIPNLPTLDDLAIAKSENPYPSNNYYDEQEARRGKGRRRGGGDRGRGNFRGRGKVGYGSHHEPIGYGTNNDYNEAVNDNDGHYDGKKDDNVHAALIAKREEFKAHHPGPSRRGGRGSHNSKPTGQHSTSGARPRTDRWQDPKNPFAFKQGNAVRGDGEGLIRGRGSNRMHSNVNKGHRGRNVFTNSHYNTPPPPPYPGLPTSEKKQDFSQNSNLLPPYNNYQKSQPPPPYSEVPERDTSPKNEEAEEEDVQKTLQALKDRVKELEQEKQRRAQNMNQTSEADRQKASNKAIKETQSKSRIKTFEEMGKQFQDINLGDSNYATNTPTMGSELKKQGEPTATKLQQETLEPTNRLALSDAQRRWQLESKKIIERDVPRSVQRQNEVGLLERECINRKESNNAFEKFGRKNSLGFEGAKKDEMLQKKLDAKEPIRLQEEWKAQHEREKLLAVEANARKKQLSFAETPQEFAGAPSAPYIRPSYDRLDINALYKKKTPRHEDENSKAMYRTPTASNSVGVRPTVTAQTNFVDRSNQNAQLFNIGRTETVVREGIGNPQRISPPRTQSTFTNQQTPFQKPMNPADKSNKDKDNCTVV